MNQTTPSPTDAAAEIIANMQRAFDVHALIDDARTKLGIEQAVEPGVGAYKVNVTGQKAIIVNNLLAKAAELDRIAKAASAEREEIKQTLADYAGDATELQVNGAPVFTYQEQTARVLDQSWIKANYPDIPGNEHFYKDQVTRPRRFK
ncbi:MAG: hypothetical protein K0R99_5030 [Microbacterium sp.]|jgi:hypothetical protein|uniref:hypothetical protein n=1 Tax=Microbacterium sp. TaxID=51671 RepID=UPI00261A3906|nr:hypothetical protein [Microbacterium sp.]MDF2563584.1 hypothetical protein [Microbacterium sp.]